MDKIKNMRPLHIIMPMAGEGSRFVREGWTTPKPLIKVHGFPLFQRALSSIEQGIFPIKYSFIVRQEHIESYGIDSVIKQIVPQADIFSVRQTTRGAVETCLLAESSLAADDAVLVMDCDLEFRCAAFNARIKQILSQDSQAQGGLLVSFPATDPRYSYAETDEKTGNVVRIAEKEVISGHALCGAYFFASSSCFLYAANKLLTDGTFRKPEFYVSLLYNYLLRENQSVQLFEVEEYYSYGTPEELGRYL